MLPNTVNARSALRFPIASHLVYHQYRASARCLQAKQARSRARSKVVSKKCNAREVTMAARTTSGPNVHGGTFREPFTIPTCPKVLDLLNRLFPAAMLLIFAGIALAQSQFGSVVGAVTDPTGAEVPGVVVRATNEASNM